MASSIALFTGPIFDKLHFDDPIAATSVHWLGGIWGQISVGLFAQNPVPLANTDGRSGLLMGGGWYLLLVQCFSSLVLSFWGIISTYPYFCILNKIIPLRMTPENEIKGADTTEHHIHNNKYMEESFENLEWIVQDMKSKGKWHK